MTQIDSTVPLTTHTTWTGKFIIRGDENDDQGIKFFTRIASCAGHNGAVQIWIEETSDPNSSPPPSPSPPSPSPAPLLPGDVSDAPEEEEEEEEPPEPVVWFYPYTANSGDEVYEESDLIVHANDGQGLKQWEDTDWEGAALKGAMTSIAVLRRNTWYKIEIIYFYVSPLCTFEFSYNPVWEDAGEREPNVDYIPFQGTPFNDVSYRGYNETEYYVSFTDQQFNATATLGDMISFQTLETIEYAPPPSPPPPSPPPSPPLLPPPPFALDMAIVNFVPLIGFFLKFFGSIFAFNVSFMPLSISCF